jgi:hypothetical protein
MRAFQFLAVVGVSFALVACGGTDESPPGEQVDTSLLTFRTGEFEIPAGDSFECFYTDTFTDKELAVTSAKGNQGPGGHHIVAYWTDVTRDPQHHPCTDDEMVTWHQIAGASGDGGAEGLIGLPDGLAIKVPEGKQLVLQSHYINTTGAPMVVDDEVSLKTVQPDEVEEYANYFVVLDDQFEIPPSAQHESRTICTLTRDFDVVLLLGHMHELGTSYKLEILDEAGAAETLYEQAWEASYASHPPVTNYSRAEPLRLTQGTRLRQTCNWNNDTPDVTLFPREMCLAFFYYYPDAGELICEVEPE